jgi:hypothetical protein
VGQVFAASYLIGFGWGLSYVASTVLGGPGQELFDAITSTIAVALVTWMVSGCDARRARPYQAGRRSAAGSHRRLGVR